MNRYPLMSAFFVVANFSKVIARILSPNVFQMVLKPECLTCASAGDEIKARTRRVLLKGPTKAIACSVCSACTLCSVCSVCTLFSVCSTCNLFSVCSACRPCSDWCNWSFPRDHSGATVAPELLSLLL